MTAPIMIPLTSCCSCDAGSNPLNPVFTWHISASRHMIHQFTSVTMNWLTSSVVRIQYGLCSPLTDPDGMSPSQGGSLKSMAR